MGSVRSLQPELRARVQGTYWHLVNAGMFVVGVGSGLACDSESSIQLKNLFVQVLVPYWSSLDYAGTDVSIMRKFTRLRIIAESRFTYDPSPASIIMSSTVRSIVRLPGANKRQNAKLSALFSLNLPSTRSLPSL